METLVMETATVGEEADKDKKDIELEIQFVTNVTLLVILQEIVQTVEKMEIMPEKIMGTHENFVDIEENSNLTSILILNHNHL